MMPNQNRQTNAGTSTEQQQFMQMNPRIEKDREMINTARKKGRGALAGTFIRLSGPGWLQSGITVGGVSFSSSLYLGVLTGFCFLWLQPIAMILGIIMLAAIAYVTLSTGQRPLRAINSHINPVLGWSWLFASMAANLVWSMPQFTLATRAIQQNLLPNIIGPEVVPDPWGKTIVVCCILAICILVTMFYGAGGTGAKIFEFIIKGIVSMIVLCFLGVVVKLSIEGAVSWGSILRGFIPDPRLFFKPAGTLMPYIGAVAENCRQFWSNLIVSQQRDVLISATAAAVGINMTFLFPYSMLRKGWDRDFRGLAIFDLSTGLFIPFVLATGFVVIASASRFHTVAAPGFVPDTPGGQITEEPAPNLVGPYNNLLARRLKFEIGEQAFTQLSDGEKKQRISALPYADRKMAAMLVKRDNFNLAKALEPLTGNIIAQYVFGLGVVGLGISAATMLMAINGLCLCELLNRRPKGWTQRIGSLMVSVGALGAIFWKQPAPWLAMPTSVFCIILIPIAYVTFILLMNQKTILGDSMPRGVKRVAWNILMVIATGVTTYISIWSLWSRLGRWSIAVIAAFVGLIMIVHFIHKTKKQATTA
jgi:Mn2+/Fe2+ NRAMP family transporter